MKRLLVVAFVALAAGLLPALAHATTYPLYAGKTTPVGTVEVTQDATMLHVTYTATAPWLLTQTHLQVAPTLAGIPQVNGNPPPGQFTYKTSHAAVSTYTYDIPLGTLGGTIYVAAHAEVINSAGGTELVTNGGFETDEVTNPAGWQIFDPVTGWLWALAPGAVVQPGDVPGVELQEEGIFPGWVDAQGLAGDQWTELDAYFPLTLWQPITLSGGWYRLLYSWSPRPGVAVNQLAVELGGTVVGTHSAAGGPVTAWTAEDEILKASGSTLRFTETGPDDQLGMLLDAVSLKRLPSESAWAAISVGTNPFEGKNWATYVTYSVLPHATAPLYDVTAFPGAFDCATGATNTTVGTTSAVGWVLDGATMHVFVTLDGALPSSTYDVWIEQNPGTCPPGTSVPSNDGAVTTDVNGDGTAHLTFAPAAGATHFWLTLWTPSGPPYPGAGTSVLRATAVTLP